MNYRKRSSRVPVPRLLHRPAGAPRRLRPGGRQDRARLLAHEPGSHRFEVIADAENPAVFYLNEVYADIAAFETHAAGPYFGAFFAEASAYAEGPTWLMRGTLVGENAAAR